VSYVFSTGKGCHDHVRGFREHAVSEPEMKRDYWGFKDVSILLETTM
jgi:hypothetical protein